MLLYLLDLHGEAHGIAAVRRLELGVEERAGAGAALRDLRLDRARRSTQLAPVDHRAGVDPHHVSGADAGRGVAGLGGGKGQGVLGEGEGLEAVRLLGGVQGRGRAGEVHVGDVAGTVERLLAVARSVGPRRRGVARQVDRGGGTRRRQGVPADQPVGRAGGVVAGDAGVAVSQVVESELGGVGADADHVGGVGNVTERRVSHGRSSE